MEQAFEKACAAHEIPNAVLLATNRDGKFTYNKAFGTMSLQTGAGPVCLDSPMWIASCTKLITTVAALQCVDDGTLSLDSDVSSSLHELKNVDLLTAFDADGKPSLKKADNEITLRQLLTHSAGLAYDLFNPTIQKWRKSQGQRIAPGSTVAERYATPLIYEPGTSWEYSPGIDFAGLLVERVTGVPLQDFMQERIWEPLGIRDMTFFPDQRPDMKKRMPAMSWRDTDTGKATNQRPGDELPPSPAATMAMGGGGLYASPTEYIKVLHALLKNDGSLLKKETLDDMFRGHLSAESHQGLMKVMSVPELNEMMGGLPEEMVRDWGLGGLLTQMDLDGWRRKGTMSWGGMPNLTWWIDREAGLCGLYASQILPPGDTKSVEMSQLFEKTMYERYEHERARL